METPWEPEGNPRKAPPAPRPTSSRKLPAEPGQAAAPPRRAAAPIPADPAERAAELDRIAAAVSSCTRCSLHPVRRHASPGQVALGAKLFAVLEVPNDEEDASGEPLSGELGQMARRLFAAMKLEEGDWCAAPAVRCRPLPGRSPSPVDRRSCHPYLHQQILLVQPIMIICFGEEALRAFASRADVSLAEVRGQWRTWKGIQIMATHSFPAMAADSIAKRQAWQDLQEAINRLSAG